ncbi:MAG: NTP transferase domain-containing protein [Aquabacterium sp.]|nr:NTP transferase domain-containing protein [Aquabacterium sp.]
MDRAPALLILANPVARGEARMRFLDALDSTLRVGLSCGLPMLLVAPGDIAQQTRQLLPGDCVVELGTDATQLSSQSDFFARAVSAGVLASANGNGWLVMPGDTPIQHADTLQKMAEALMTQSVVYPQYHQMQGYPIGFSSEFYSELIRLQTERDWGRLMARYPAQGIDVDDVGVLASATDHNLLAPFMGQQQSDLLGRGLQ